MNAPLEKLMARLQDDCQHPEWICQPAKQDHDFIVYGNHHGVFPRSARR